MADPTVDRAGNRSGPGNGAAGGGRPAPPADGADLNYEDLIASYADGPDRVPRDWLAAEIRARLSRPGCRYVLVTGEPGAGKTGIMAALAGANPDWLRYFIRSDSTTPLSSGDAVSMLMRIGFQFAHRRPELFDPGLLEIVVNQRAEKTGADAAVTGVIIDQLKVSPFYRTAIRVQQDIKSLSGALVGVEIAQAIADPRLLELDTLSYFALLDPAAALARENPDQILVILVDALDEVIGFHGGATVLDWLETGPALPANLRFVLSSRPHARLRTLEGVRGEAMEIIAIESGSAEVGGDVRAFAAGLFEETAVLARFPAIDPESAEASLGRAAQGNFAYLTAYARSLRAALAAGDDEAVKELVRFEELPKGLHPLYATFVRRLRRQVERLGRVELSTSAGPEADVPAWEGVGQRFLCVLAVARAPLSLDQLMALGGVRVWKSAAGNVLQCFVPFLDALESGWSFFHPSLGEFLKAADPAKLPELAVDGDEWNVRIVRYYRGDAAAWADVDWAALDDYGLLHLAEHIAEGAEGSKAVGQLVIHPLRSAAKARFGSDLAFRRIVQVAKAGAEMIEEMGKRLPALVFAELVLSGLSAGAAELDPPVYGLMARLGRVEAAIARAEVLAPGLHKYRALEAIQQSTPESLRGKLGPNDGVDLLVGAALDVPLTKTGGLIGFPGRERAKCLREAACALAPHDLDRALRLIGMIEDDSDSGRARDEVLAATGRVCAPERALETVAGMGEGGARAAAAAAERAEDDGVRGKLVDLAVSRLADADHAERLHVLAVLIALGAADPAAQTQPLEADLLRTLDELYRESAESGAYRRGAAIEPAKRLHDRRPELAVRLLAGVELAQADSASAWVMVTAARLWASWDRPEDCRRLLEKALVYYRSLGWFGPAGDIARVAEVAAGIDRPWAEALADEAISLLEPEVKKGDRFELRLDGALAAAAAAFRGWDLDRALRVTRWMTGHWIHGGSWDSMDGRGSALAMYGLDAAAEDPKFAAQILAECLAGADIALRLGRASSELVDFGLFLPAGTVGRDSSAAMTFIPYVRNSVNYWLGGRRWRLFETPADVLRSTDFDFPAGASWARAVAAAVPHAAALDPELSLSLAESLADPCERLIALAGLARAFDVAGDPRRDRVLRLVGAAARALPAYQPGIPLDDVPQGPALFYNNPAVRARFEAALALPTGNGGLDTMLIEATGSGYVDLAWRAEIVFRGLAEALPPAGSESRFESFLDDLSKADDLIGGLVNLAFARALAPGDAARARHRIEAIQNGTIQAMARLLCLPLDLPRADLSGRCMEILDALPEDVSLLHRAGLAAIAVRLCRAAGDDGKAALDWGLAALEGSDPLFVTRGLVALAAVAPEPQRGGMLSRALQLSPAIRNDYMRNDALADLLGAAVALAEPRLAGQLAGRLIETGWHNFVEALRRAMPALVAAAGPDIVERLDAAMRSAQDALGAPPAAPDGVDHLDGVLAAHLRRNLLDEDGAEPSGAEAAYLALFLDEGDLPASLRRVQDSRTIGPDRGDAAFARLGGRQTGLQAWMDEPDRTLWRLVDIRFAFEDAAAAAAYHRERLVHNSEGQPPIEDAPLIGDDCAVFGGTQVLEIQGHTISMTSVYYIFRVGNVVVKLFGAQGHAAEVPLTPEQLFSLAERAAKRVAANAAGGPDTIA